MFQFICLQTLNAAYSINAKAFQNISDYFALKNVVIVRDITNSFYHFQITRHVNILKQLIGKIQIVCIRTLSIRHNFKILHRLHLVLCLMFNTF